MVPCNSLRNSFSFYHRFLTFHTILMLHAHAHAGVPQMLQCDDGHWSGDYGGPLFLMPGMIIAFYVTGTPLGESRRGGMEAYLRNHQQVGRLPLLEVGGSRVVCACVLFFFMVFVLF